MKAFKYQQLLKTLGEQEVVITATQRLASFLEQEYGRIKAQEGKAVWVRPAVFSFSNWLKTLWLRTKFQRDTLLLSEFQALVVWQRIIQASGELPVALAESAAKLASEAFSLIQEWELPFPFPSRMLSEDMRRFQNWTVSFQTLCQENHWLTFADLPQDLSKQFQAGTLTPPKKITLLGFGELNKAYQTLLQTLQDLGSQVEYYADDFRARQINRLELENIETEILTMAHWAKTTLQTNPSNHFIGCIVPQLEQRRSLVQQTFNTVFADSDFSFDLSAPMWFDKISLVHILFKLFDLGEMRIHLTDLGLLLRTPFMGGANIERILRARLDTELKKVIHGEISIEALLQLASEENTPFYCPLWRQQVINFRALLAALSDKRFLPSVFAEKFMDAFSILGWPGERQLTQEEAQVIQRLQQALKEFASLDVIYGEMTLKQARIQFEWMTKQILFQSKLNECAPVQILGTLEPAGMLFSHLWVLGLNDEAWPSAARPHPFIPLEMQSQFDLPHSSAARELKFSQLLTQQFSQMASQVIFSSAKQDGDIKFRPSRLLDQFEVMEVAELNLLEDRTQDSGGFSEFVSPLHLEYLTDNYAPPIPSGQRVKGGAYLFELQSACPFRAFAEIRLHARALEKTRAHLSAKERGALIHHALELVWKALESQDRLLSESTENIRQIIFNSVETAMAKMYIPLGPQDAKLGAEITRDLNYFELEKPKEYSLYFEDFPTQNNLKLDVKSDASLRILRSEGYKGNLDKLTSGFNRIEQQCLVNLIEKWLFLHEKERPAFRITALESSSTAELKGYFFQLKTDRIDELCADKKQLIIDYKTGLVSKEDWFGERPDKPQLPLYCVTSKVPVSGVLFAQMKAGQLAFKGLVEEGIEIDGAQTLSSEDWVKQQSDWKVHLENLVAQFSEGYAKVDPKEGEKSCRFCGLKMLCRVASTA